MSPQSVTPSITSNLVRELAAECGFALAGVARADPHRDFTRFRSWVDRGLAADMKYLTDRRADVRGDPSQLLEGVRSIISVGLVFSSGVRAASEADSDAGWIARYAWGEDYHTDLKARLQKLAEKLMTYQDFSWRACVDTAPLLERSYAAKAGLGWIGKNTCLINEQKGSWILLGELLTTLELAPDNPAADRCGSCTRCIQACPTDAIVPSIDGRYELDSRLCISYFTIESRGPMPHEHREAAGKNVFGCDICQDVCPWNRKAGPMEQPREAPPLERLASLSQAEFRGMFRETAVSRVRYTGFLRNVAVAMGNARLEKFRAPLEKLAKHEDPMVAEHALWALERLDSAG